MTPPTSVKTLGTHEFPTDNTLYMLQSFAGGSKPYVTLLGKESWKLVPNFLQTLPHVLLLCWLHLYQYAIIKYNHKSNNFLVLWILLSSENRSWNESSIFKKPLEHTKQLHLCKHYKYALKIKWVLRLILTKLWAPVLIWNFVLIMKAILTMLIAGKKNL